MDQRESIDHEAIISRCINKLSPAFLQIIEDEALAGNSPVDGVLGALDAFGMLCGAICKHTRTTLLVPRHELTKRFEYSFKVGEEDESYESGEEPISHAASSSSRAEEPVQE